MLPKLAIVQTIKGAISDYRAMLRYSKFNNHPQEAFLYKVQQERSLFIHIPKTGGKSIMKSLYGADLHEGFGHASIAFYKGIFTSKTFSNLFKFAFVRNPWDRLYSGHQFAINGGFGLPTDLQLKAKIMEAAGSNFADFVKHWLPFQDIHNSVIFRPQHTFICNKQGQILVDRICYFEHFQQEHLFLQNKLGIEQELLHLNRSQQTNPYAEVYDGETKSIVADLYQQDIETFGYAFVGAPSLAFQS